MHRRPHEPNHEHSPSGAVLLRGPPRRHHRGGAQHPLRHSATGGERAGGAVGGIPGGDAVPAAALRADARRREAVSVSSSRSSPTSIAWPANCKAARPAKSASAPPTIVLRDHLPDVFQNVRKRFPNLKISLREGYPAEFENLLLEGGAGSGGNGDREEAGAGTSLGGAGRTAAGSAGRERAAGSPPPTSFGSGIRSRSRSSACRPRRPSARISSRDWPGWAWIGSPASKSARWI